MGRWRSKPLISAAKRRRARGFTLLEALVALFIVAIGMAAVFMQLNQYINTATYIRDKTLASWIASNRLTEISIQPGWPELGDEREELEYANRLWTLDIATSETEVENLRRVDISISLPDSPDIAVHRVSALIEPSPPRGFAPLRWPSIDGGGA
jgi:general secretion pathway protein I